MRRLALGGLVFVALVIGGLLFFLAPGHFQIRGIDPPLPAASELFETLAVDDGPVQVQFLNTASQALPDQTSMAYPGFVLTWNDGRRFMIDAGMERDAAIAFGKPLEWLLGAEAARPLGSVGEQMGSRSGEVGAVAFTHLHSDHTGGIRSLCAGRNSDLVLYQTPLQAEERNHTTDMGYALISEAGCARASVLGDAPLYRTAEYPGLVAVAAGGHTPGSTIFLAEVGGHRWVFSGDITNSRSELENDIPKHFLYSLLIVPESPDRQAALRAWLRDLDRDPGTTVVVSHDLDALEASGISGWR